MQRTIALVVLGAIVASATAGPISEYFISDGNSGKLSVVKGNSVVRSWQLRDNDNMPLAVLTTVRTFGEYPQDVGSEYKLDGTYTGVDYPDQGGPQNQRIDGTTDGKYNYLAGYNDGGIWRYSLDWKNPERLFAVASPTGITYDLKSGNLWVVSFQSKSVIQYKLDGTVVSSFPYNTPSGWMGCLAYEPATDTLWATNFSSNDVYQFDKTGKVLENVQVPGLAGYAWGGEFAIPEPGTLLLVLLALPVLRRR